MPDFVLPDDPTRGQEFFWTRQGISLQHLYEYIQLAVADAVAGTAPGTGGGGTSNVVIGTEAGQAADAAAVSQALLVKAPLTSPHFEGVPTAPTAVLGTNTTQIATTEFVLANGGGGGGGGTDSPHFTGIPTAPTAVAGTNTTQLATTAFVEAESLVLQAIIDAQADLITAMSDRIALLEQLGANMVAIAGATSARVNQVDGTALHPDSVVIWFTDGSDAVNALNGDGIYNRAPL